MDCGLVIPFCWGGRVTGGTCPNFKLQEVPQEVPEVLAELPEDFLKFEIWTGATSHSR